MHRKCLLYVLKNKNLLNNTEKIIGIDLSKERIKRLEYSCPFVKGLVSDVCNLAQIEDNSFDLVISSQVIEHVDDTKILSNIYRIIKPRGYLYISTVIKKWYGCWIYWNNGFKLDPTHVREYKSKEEFIDLLKNNRFDVKERCD